MTGNMVSGEAAHTRIAAGSVVLNDVAPRCTVAGVPAKPIGGECKQPAALMNQVFDAGL